MLFPPGNRPGGIFHIPVMARAATIQEYGFGWRLFIRKQVPAERAGPPPYSEDPAPIQALLLRLGNNAGLPVIQSPSILPDAS